MPWSGDAGRARTGRAAAADHFVRHNLPDVTRSQINELVGATAAAVSLGLYVGLILRPAWLSYTRLWERMAATLLSLYLLAVLVGAGVAGALLAVYYWG